MSLLFSFDKPVLHGILLKRYKRFLADVYIPELSETHTIHCPNTGSMLGLNKPDYPVLITDSENPKRKLRYTLECVKPLDTSRSWVCVNTTRANQVVDMLFKKGLLPGYDAESIISIQKEPRYNQETRLDFLITQSIPKKTEFSRDFQEVKTYVEVKSVTLSLEKNRCSFPDAITTRGQKHLKTLLEIEATSPKSRIRSAMVYACMRDDCRSFAVENTIDPVYADLLQRVFKENVTIFIPVIRINTKGFYLHNIIEYSP
jgi:sugar fermentation stimulation protein A